MTSPESSPSRSVWLGITLLAAAMLAVTMGIRQTVGLFVSPLNTSTGLGLVDISLAIAVAQFMWGAVQPFTGALADRYGAGRVLAGGVVVLALSQWLTPMMDSTLGLIVSIGVLSAGGAGASSFSVLIGAVAQRIPAEKRGVASGVINAGGSFGQFIFAPIVQGLIGVVGWVGAMWSLALIALSALPLAWWLRRPASLALHHAANNPADGGMWQAIRTALQDRSYWLLHAGFFTCGFHVAFLVTHLPGEINLCGLTPQVAGWSLALIGLANIAGSLVVGWTIQSVRCKWVLFWMYFSRAVLVVAYLLAPKTEWTFYLFAIGLGFTWLATVPPTAGIVGKLFGVRYLGTLFGLTLLSHQIGGFFGAWLGGLAMAHLGDYSVMWYADMVLAVLAAVANLPIREAKILRTQPA